MNKQGIRFAGIVGSFVSVIVIVMFASVIIGAFLFPYAINTWLVYMGKTAVVLWWHGALLGAIPGISQTSIPLAIVTYIAMLFLV
jgi:hypothetical protein